EEAGRVVVDLARSWRGSKGNPVKVDPTLDAIAELSRTYSKAKVLIDQYSAEPIRQALVSRGVAVEARPWTNETKSEAVVATRRLLRLRLPELPNHPELAAELVSLESHPLPSGRPRIAAPPGAHDDHASALLALVNELAGHGTVSALWRAAARQ